MSVANQQLQNSNQQLQYQLAQANAAIEQKDAVIAALNVQVGYLQSTNLTYRASNNAAPFQWFYGYYDQGAEAGAPFVQTGGRILDGYSHIAVAPVDNSPGLGLITLSMAAQGLLVNIPANWSTGVIVFELEFGHLTTGLQNNNDVADAMYRLSNLGMDANLTPYPYFHEIHPTGGVGAGGAFGALSLRALHRLAYQYTFSQNPSQITIGIDFVNGGGGSQTAVYAGFSCVFKQYRNSLWQYIP